MDCSNQKIEKREGNMKYSFKSGYYKEGNRTFIKIPFNVWDTCGKKGKIPVKVFIDGTEFECKLIPKGNGEYVIPVNKDVIEKPSYSDKFDVEFVLVDQLTRINNNSPYSKDNPIRQIDNINYVKQPGNGLCGQTCLAMLAGISVDEVIKITKSTKWQASISKVLETLDYFGFLYEKPVYTYGKKIKLPRCCLINARGSEKNHLLVCFEGSFYDPAAGVSSDYLYENIISFIEIKTL